MYNKALLQKKKIFKAKNLSARTKTKFIHTNKYNVTVQKKNTEYSLARCLHGKFFFPNTYIFISSVNMCDSASNTFTQHYYMYAFFFFFFQHIFFFSKFCAFAVRISSLLAFLSLRKHEELRHSHTCNMRARDGKLLRRLCIFTSIFTFLFSSLMRRECNRRFRLLWGDANHKMEYV